MTRRDAPWIVLILTLIAVAWGAGYYAGMGHAPTVPPAQPIVVSVQVPASAAPAVDPAIIAFVKSHALEPAPVRDAGVDAAVVKPQASARPVVQKAGPAPSAAPVPEEVKLEDDPTDIPNPYRVAP